MDRDGGSSRRSRPRSRTAPRMLMTRSGPEPLQHVTAVRIRRRHRGFLPGRPDARDPRVDFACAPSNAVWRDSDSTRESPRPLEPPDRRPAQTDALMDLMPGQETVGSDGAARHTRGALVLAMAATLRWSRSEDGGFWHIVLIGGMLRSTAIVPTPPNERT